MYHRQKYYIYEVRVVPLAEKSMESPSLTVINIYILHCLDRADVLVPKSDVHSPYEHINGTLIS